MAIRVAHIGTGNVGRLALTGLLTNPQLELTGLCVSSEDKVGRDAGELAGLDVSTGIFATNDLGERTLASYAVTDGALFIRSETHLWKIGR